MLKVEALAAWPFRGEGTEWVAVRTHRYAMDDWVRVRVAAELAGVQVRRIALWRRDGRLPGRCAGRTWQYQVRDVLKLSAPRGKEPQ